MPSSAELYLLTAITKLSSIELGSGARGSGWTQHFPSKTLQDISSHGSLDLKTLFISSDYSFELACTVQLQNGRFQIWVWESGNPRFTTDCESVQQGAGTESTLVKFQHLPATNLHKC